MLDIEIGRLQQTIVRLSSESSKAAITAKTLRTILNYSWDQTEKHVKLYVSLSEVIGTIEADQVEIDTKQRRTVSVTAANSRLIIANLHAPLADQGHYAKVTKSNLIVYLEKATAGSWPSLQQKVNQPSPLDKAPLSEDPSKGLMDMMKKMYEEGDDEMKRTIGKAWFDSSRKNGTGSESSMPNFDMGF